MDASGASIIVLAVLAFVAFTIGGVVLAVVFLVTRKAPNQGELANLRDEVARLRDDNERLRKENEKLRRHGASEHPTDIFEK